MSSESSPAVRNFEMLGQLVDRIGPVVVRQALLMAEESWSAGADGPVVASEEGAPEAFALALNRDSVDFRLGGETGTLPLAALRMLAGSAEKQA